MTASVATTPPAEHTGRRRNIIAIVLVAIVLAGGVATTATLRHLDHQYGPVYGGRFGGPVCPHRVVINRQGTSCTSRGPEQLIAALSNAGAHSVRITSIDHTDIVGDVQWSTYRLANGGAVDGEPSPVHAFPGVIPAHGTIRLVISLNRPTNCARDLNRYDGNLTVHWRSLLSAHTDLLAVVSFAHPISLC